MSAGFGMRTGPKCSERTSRAPAANWIRAISLHAARKASKWTGRSGYSMDTRRSAGSRSFTVPPTSSGSSPS